MDTDTDATENESGTHADTEAMAKDMSRRPADATTTHAAWARAIRICSSPGRMSGTSSR